MQDILAKLETGRNGPRRNIAAAADFFKLLLKAILIQDVVAAAAGIRQDSLL